VRRGFLDIAALDGTCELINEYEALRCVMTMAPPEGSYGNAGMTDSIWCSIWKRENSGASSRRGSAVCSSRASHAP
jgi:hypothetical protein